MTPGEHQRRLRELFREEAAEHFDTIHRALSDAHEDEDSRAEAIRVALRAAHSVKGGAAVSGLESLQTMMHNWESCATALGSGRMAWTKEALDLLSRALDAASDELAFRCGGSDDQRLDPHAVTAELHGLFASHCQLRGLDPEPDAGVDSGTAPQRSRLDAQGTVRVATEKLDRQLAGVEELLRLKLGDEKRLESLTMSLAGLERVRAMLSDARRLSRSTANAPGPVRASDTGRPGLDETTRLVDEVASRLAAALLETRQATHERAALADSLHAEVRAVRMLPVDSALAPFSRMVRDLGRSTGKHMVLRTTGGATEVDRDVLEAVKDPVMHLLRNAVDHGIEPPAERGALRKPREAVIEMRASSSAGMLEIDILDDGRGISSELVGKAAVERGLVSADQLAQMDRDAVLALIFQDGFSTAGVVSNVSGRGVGLAVVRNTVERLGGRVTVTTTVGAGTCFRVVVPLNLATSRLLLVEVAGEPFAIPALSVERVARVDVHALSRIDHGYAFDLDGKPVIVSRLADTLGLAVGEETVDRRPAVVVAAASGRAAFVVDRIIDEQELVARELGDHLRAVPNVSGAAVLADGSVAPILNVGDLLRSTRRTPESAFDHSPTSAAKTNRRILVVDDSVTTRTLERSILEAAGYDVEVANDGVEALERLGRASFDLVLSDVQMPRVDGLALVRAVKQDPRWKSMPIVLVSSLDKAEQRREGLEAGADAYLSKAEFEQGVLLSTLGQFL